MKKYVKCPICDKRFKEDAKGIILIHCAEGDTIHFCVACSFAIWEANIVGSCMKKYDPENYYKLLAILRWNE